MTEPTEQAWTPVAFRDSPGQTAAAIRCSTCPARSGSICNGHRMPLDLQRLLSHPSAENCPLGRWTDRRLHVLTTLFNPQHSQRIRNNYQRFRSALPVGMPVHTAEVTFGDHQPEISDSLWIRATPSNSPWLKERLLNLLLATLPTNVEYVAWIDADVLFENSDWHVHAIEQLREWPTAQLFSTALWLDAEGREEMQFTSAAALKHHPQEGHWGHPGFAWAARRSALKAGFFDADPTGGADTFMSDHFCGYKNSSPKTRAMSEAYATWRRRTAYGVGVVAGTIRHLFHGTWTDRRYVERSRFVTDFNFDPARDLAVDTNGLWRWTDANPGMRAAFESYMPKRKDDGK